MLPFPRMLACEAGHFLSSVAVFAGEACKHSNTRPFVSAVGAKSAETQHFLQSIDQCSVVCYSIVMRRNCGRNGI